MFLNLRLSYGAAREIHETFSSVLRVRDDSRRKRSSDPGKFLCLHYRVINEAEAAPRLDLEAR